MAGSGQIELWVAAARRGDRAALAKLLAAHHPALRARAEFLMDPAIKTRISPDDLLQEVYLDVARRIDRFEDRGPDSFLNWMQAILNQKLVDARRAAHRQVRDIDREVAVTGAATDSHWNLLDNLYADSGTPSRAVRREEALSAMLTCIDELSGSHREVIQLRYLEGLSVAEAGRRLGKSEAAVAALTKRALTALHESMDRLGEFTRGS
jgi:RNA polymerase sigma-70 factor (ECF subfamily)